MTDIVALQPEPAPESAQEPATPEPVHCRHCGQPHEPLAPDANPDWLCPSCERYQDSMTCPYCGQITRISLLPAEMAPEPHAPARRRKAKEDQ